MLSQINQIMGEEDVEGKRLMAEYLETCLKDYKERNCVAPDIGEPFPALPSDGVTKSKGESSGGASISRMKGNFVIRRRRDEEEEGDDAADRTKPIIAKDDVSSPSTTSNNSHSNDNSKNNSVIRRVNDVLKHNANETSAAPSAMMGAGRGDQNREENATEWRRRNKMEAQINAAVQTSSSQSMIQRLSEREHHAGGIRRPGCPCCDPDNPSNVVDNMMML
jgi:hypothetical protein